MAQRFIHVLFTGVGVFVWQSNVVGLALEKQKLNTFVILFKLPSFRPTIYIHLSSGICDTRHRCLRKHPCGTITKELGNGHQVSTSLLLSISCSNSRRTFRADLKRSKSIPSTSRPTLALRMTSPCTAPSFKPVPCPMPAATAACASYGQPRSRPIKGKIADSRMLVLKHDKAVNGSCDVFVLRSAGLPAATASRSSRGTHSITSVGD